jgi:ABC-type uncharacterized transport system permease subunit
MQSDQHQSVDVVALNSLFRRYWSIRGWTKGTISAAEFAHAKVAGVIALFLSRLRLHPSVRHQQNHPDQHPYKP